MKTFQTTQVQILAPTCNCMTLVKSLNYFFSLPLFIYLLNEYDN